MCNGLVNRMSLVGSVTNVRLVLTNFPRILIINDATSVLLDQLVFDQDHNSKAFPTIRMVKFYIDLYLI